MPPFSPNLLPRCRPNRYASPSSVKTAAATPTPIPASPPFESAFVHLVTLVLGVAVDAAPLPQFFAVVLGVAVGAAPLLQLVVLLARMRKPRLSVIGDPKFCEPTVTK